MDSLSSVEGGLNSNPGGILLDGRLLHDYLTDSSSVCGRLLGSTPARRRYKVRLCGIKTQECAVFCGGGVQCSQSSGAPVGPGGGTAKSPGRDGTAKRSPSSSLMPTCRAT